MDDDAVLEVLDEAVGAVASALATLEGWGPAGTRPGQYRLDLAADAAAVAVLHQAGLAVQSEESGLTEPGAPDASAGSSGPGADGAPSAGRGGELLAVLDPVDGSTNAFHGLPWYSTSICVLDDEGPWVSLVVNHATGARYHAVRGGGAWRDGRPIHSSGCTALGEAIVATSGWPQRHLGWRQLRIPGASSLDLCAVAEGVLDGFLVTDDGALFGWDYLGALLVCTEAGVAVGERQGCELVVRDDAPRSPVAGATPTLLDALLRAAA